MVTLVEPQKHISDLWGKQRIIDTDSYRLMRYVLRVNYRNKVLLHNVVTGQLVLLDQKEVEIIDNRSIRYSPLIDSLVKDHFVVNFNFDEHEQVVKMRTVLRMLDDSKPKPITHYTILPTTVCNARCYYCFEQGSMKSCTMTKSICVDVADYIARHCGDKQKVYISWFGGEPTIADQCIDMISTGLRERGIDYSSVVVTNGLLFNEEMVNKAKTVWNVTGVQITVDGVESNNNKIKAFVDKTVNPYKQVMNNIELLLEKGMNVVLRMNFDLENYNDFKNLLQEVVQRFHHNPLLTVYAHPILGEYPNPDGKVLHGNLEWLGQMNYTLNEMSRDAGLAKKDYPLPFLRYRGCAADQDTSLAIHANGSISRCMEQFDKEQIVGNVRDGIVDEKLYRSWRQVADYDLCQQCVLFPKCVRIVKCSGGDRCFGRYDLIHKTEETVRNSYNQYILGGNIV